MAIIPPVIVVMEKACRSAAKGLVRDFGELEKLQISKKDKNDFVSSADLRASETIQFNELVWWDGTSTSIHNTVPRYMYIELISLS